METVNLHLSARLCVLLTSEDRTHIIHTSFAQLVQHVETHTHKLRHAYMHAGAHID